MFVTEVRRGKGRLEGAYVPSSHRGFCFIAPDPTACSKAAQQDKSSPGTCLPLLFWAGRSDTSSKSPEGRSDLCCYMSRFSYLPSTPCPVSLIMLPPLPAEPPHPVPWSTSTPQCPAQPLLPLLSPPCFLPQRNAGAPFPVPPLQIRTHL